MLLAMKDEVGSNLSNEENDFMLDTSYGEDLEELTTAAMLMARLQPADENVKTVPSYDAKAVSQVHASSKVHEQVSHGKCKTIIQTTDDDQIDSNIIFDDLVVENNGGTSEHNSTAHNQYREIQMLAYNVQQTCDELEQELRNDKDTIDHLVKEKEKIQNDFFKVENEKIIIQHETQLENKAFKEREDRYLDDILDLEEKLKQQKHELLKVELEKSASDSRDIQANLLKRIKILENNFQRSQAQSINFELKLQHQKDKMDCDVSWKAKLSTLHDENVLLKHQVESTVKERENISVLKGAPWRRKGVAKA
ncbi:hypothetical protein Tco_0000288 [Tanacetum coccineum]